MAIFYARDLMQLGYRVKPKKMKRKGILTSVLYSELLTEEQVIPCLATFFRFGNGVRIDYILDKELENKVYKSFHEHLRSNPRYLFEYFIRNLVKITASVLAIIGIIWIAYLFGHAAGGLSERNLKMILDLLVCVVLSSIVRYIISGSKVICPYCATNIISIFKSLLFVFTNIYWQGQKKIPKIRNFFILC